MLLKAKLTILLVLGFILFGGLDVSIQAAQADFDGDGKTDIAIYRFNTSETWHLKSSDGGNGAVTFGNTFSLLVPADYTGDGITDVAYFDLQNGEWFILRSEDNSFYSFQFGIGGQGHDDPRPGDYDGDGKADPAVYRRDTGTWYILRSTDGQLETHQFGGAESDFPVKAADYDGDGKDDIAIYRVDEKQWWINRSRDGVVAYTFGEEEPFIRIVFADDYTGDGKADLVYLRSENSGVLTGDEAMEWFVLRSEDNSFYSFPFGFGTDIPARGDYDGDGIADVVVYRRNEGTWYLQESTNGFRTVQFGNDQDFPVSTPMVD